MWNTSGIISKVKLPELFKMHISVIKFIVLLFAIKKYSFEFSPEYRADVKLVQPLLLKHVQLFVLYVSDTGEHTLGLEPSFHPIKLEKFVCVTCIWKVAMSKVGFLKLKTSIYGRDTLLQM